MTNIPSNLVENPNFEPYRPKNGCPRKGISVFAFVFPIAICISIFYIFRLPPYSIFNDTKFLFFVSNTLILIIAADYGAFRCKEKHDLYQDYVMRSHARNPSRFLSLSQIPEFTKRVNNIVPIEEEKASGQEVIKKEIVNYDRPLEQLPEKILPVVSENEPLKTTTEHKAKENGQIIFYEEACDARKDTKGKTHRRSKSDKARRVTIIENSDTKHNNETSVDKTKDCEMEKTDEGRVYRRSKSDSAKWIVDQNQETEVKHETVGEENDEFSSMSNEELNRRVEEFIERFNRQIKLQGRRNSQILLT